MEHDSGSMAAATRRRGTRGQSLVEFAIVIPVLLTLVGGALDVARVFQANNVLESAARNAAEKVASYSKTSADAATDAATVICAETKSIPGYVANASSPGGCSSPSVTITSFTVSTTAPGALALYPVASVVLTATVPFRTLYPYPLFTQNGAWTLRATESYSIAQGR
jgi:Flp pilus assembly protein TadG